ncbi:MAG: hypothetical protein OXG04_23700 [Acidobacteria bacterium]|nr:hypothetical protein [Acidobacteriota bacterium]
MFDTLAVAQQLAGDGVARDQAEVIAKAIHDGRTRLIHWMVGTVIATATLTVGILRLLG